MTIGRNSRKGSLRSSIRAPKFLDKSSGFYGRLDEPEMFGERDGGRGGGGGREAEAERWNGTCEETSGAAQVPAAEDRGEAGVFDFNVGMMEDDEEILLRRKPGRLSSRWRRSSRRKQQKKEEEAEDDPPAGERSSRGAESGADSPAALEVTAVEAVETVGDLKEEEEEPALVHLAMRADADDQVLIRDKKRGREEEGEEEEEKNKEEEEERRMEREQEEGMKAVKRNTMKNYRKALDRAFRRGWESFITNLYSVTLTPIASSSSSPSPSSPSSKKKQQHGAALAELR